MYSLEMAYVRMRELQDRANRSRASRTTTARRASVTDRDDARAAAKKRR
ncbi:hypothetical protein [Streptomyces sp. NPDC003077]